MGGKFEFLLTAQTCWSEEMFLNCDNYSIFLQAVDLFPESEPFFVNFSSYRLKVTKVKRSALANHLLLCHPPL